MYHYFFPFPSSPFLPFLLLIIIISVSSFLLVLITILAPLHITTFLAPCRNFSTNLFSFFPLSLSFSYLRSFLTFISFSLFLPFFFFWKILATMTSTTFFLKRRTSISDYLEYSWNEVRRRVRFNLSFTFKESNCVRYLTFSSEQVIYIRVRRKFKYEILCTWYHSSLYKRTNGVRMESFTYRVTHCIYIAIMVVE